MWIIGLILFIAYAFIIIMAAIGFLKQKKKLIPSNSKQSIQSVSIVIPARNEANNIIPLLESILKNKTQNIDFEVILVDDCSEDETAALAADFFQQYPIGFLIKMEEVLQGAVINSYKKKALETGIAAAQYDWIVQTDADCIVPPNWLQSLSPYFNLDQFQFIASPVDLLPISGGLASRVLYGFQSIDFMTMQGITAATHYFQIGLMCNGANLAFRKSAFQAVGGYQDIDSIASGDDMLLLHKISHHFPQSSTYVINSEAIVRTASQPSIGSFFQQRIRWSSKAGHYKDKRLSIILLGVFGFNLFLLSLGIFSFFKPEFVNLTLSLFLGKIIIEYILLIPVSRFFKKETQLIVFPFLQIFHIPYIVITALLGLFGKYKWKNRTVK